MSYKRSLFYHNKNLKNKGIIIRENILYDIIPNVLLCFRNFRVRFGFVVLAVAKFMIILGGGRGLFFFCEHYRLLEKVC